MPAGKHIDLVGVRLWYVDTGGGGDVIVLLHANTGTSRSWQYQIEPFASAGYRVICFDRCGYGNSVADPSRGERDGSVSEDLEALADALDLQSFNLIGVAGGGFVALDYAAWRPHRLRSLVVCASTGKFTDEVIQTVIKQIEIPGIRQQSAAYRELGPSYRAGNSEGVQHWLDIESATPHAEGAAGRLLRTPNTLAKLNEITAPVLVIAGCADLIAPPALMKLWASHLPGHVWKTIPEAGHAVPWEVPAAFNAAVLEFMHTARPPGLASPPGNKDEHS